jgi:hypothetical protein
MIVVDIPTPEELARSSIDLLNMAGGQCMRHNCGARKL